MTIKTKKSLPEAIRQGSMTTIVLGSQFGDEGEGKLLDLLSQDAQICARAAGGPVIYPALKKQDPSRGTDIVDEVLRIIAEENEEKALHILPKGLNNPGCYNLVGSEVLFYVPRFFEEIERREKKGIEKLRERIFVSDRCWMKFDLDVAEEKVFRERKAEGDGDDSPIPTGRKIRLGELFNEAAFETKLRKLAASSRKRFGDALQYDVEDEITRFKGYRANLATHVVDAAAFMKQAQDQNYKILVHGGQISTLDTDDGAFPLITSLGGIFGGVTLNPKKVDEIIGVVKAYTTRQEEDGPLLAEADDGTKGKLSDIDMEIDPVGQFLRTGWLDLVLVKHSATCNHYTALNLTRLHLFDTLQTIKVAISYAGPDGTPLESLPTDPSLVEQCTVVYKDFPGWQTSTIGAKTFYDLPAKARAYVAFIEEYVGVKVKYIGTGPEKEDMIVRV